MIANNTCKINALKKVVFINGSIREKNAELVKKEAESFQKDQTIYFRIDSEGGNMGYFNLIHSILYDKYISLNCYYIAEIIHAESCALLLALIMDERHIMPGSLVSIHLPHPAKGLNIEDVGIEELKKKKEETIAFYCRTTNLTEQQVNDLENVFLTSKELMEYDIATHKVPIFRNYL